MLNKLESENDEHQKMRNYLEEKIKELMNLIEELEQGQVIYIAHKNDKIDRLMAGFLNKYPERKNLGISFIRESEGVYKFGKKRIYIKIERKFKFIG